MLITTVGELKRYVIPWLQGISKLPRSKRAIAVDTETFAPDNPGNKRQLKNEGLILDRGRIMLISLGHGTTTFSIPLKSFDPRFPTIKDVMGVLSRFLRGRRLKKICHNLNYDYNMFMNHGIRLRNVYCTSVAGSCQNENLPRALNERAIQVGIVLKKAKNAKERKELFTDWKKTAPYAEQDVLATWALFEAYEFGTVPRRHGIPIEEIRALRLSKRRRRFFAMEMETLRTVINMERRGMKIHVRRLAELDRRIRRLVDKLRAKLNVIAGKPINPRSRTDLPNLLFKKLKIKPHKKTKSGKAWSTDKESLLYMKGRHKVIDILLDLSAYQTLLNYTNALKGLRAHADSRHRIHPTINSVGAVTFRFTCSNPNLQNIPAKMDVLLKKMFGFGIRSAFIAEKGNVLVVADYSQIELRLMGVMSEDRRLVRAYRKNLDIHDQTMKALGISIRTIAKNCNFGLMYGGSAWTLARQLTMDGIPTTPQKAQEYVDAFFRTYRGVPAFRERLNAMCRRKGYVLNLAGRPRTIEHINHSDYRMRRAAERQLINNVIQGSASDWIKPAMNRIERDPLMKKWGYFLTMQIHDELVGECPRKNKKKVMKRLKMLMEMPPEGGLIKDLPFPVTASVAFGDDWASAKG